jgi:hypothetical protein
MAKFIAGNPACKEVEVGGRIVKKDRHGHFDIPDGAASREVAKSAFFSASNPLAGGWPGVPDRICPKCGFNSLYSTCGRCGTATPKAGSESQ